MASCRSTLESKLAVFIRSEQPGLLEQGPGARLATAKLLVAPSLGNESFGMILTRAFACSTPVVASDIPGYAEVVTPDTGALTPPDDSDALAETIENVLAHEPARVEKGAAARRRAETEFAWPLLARRLESCYERVLAS